ncbi:conserved Plasmodium protein, unknown function [Plasmodium berghei]|uniref:Uncharacterized protein n=1 Tax=Plasmodium berghei TaxID=5821 RepID=A0A1C6Y9R0_PLABE|nr:conserved Plasmodium protein, unknown function [Plasmodium berghei]SCN23650.1 conserved Plasmodium protein, unknown function [Plasmodium berghei]SCO59194.1 conserved Plasmodium protein, unknown function [Plasmodium berghei]
MDLNNANNLKESLDKNYGKNDGNDSLMHKDNNINEDKMLEQSEKIDNIDDKKTKNNIETSNICYGDSANSSFDTSKRIGDLIMGKGLNNSLQLKMECTNKIDKPFKEKVQNPKIDEIEACHSNAFMKTEIIRAQSNNIYNNRNEKNSLKKNVVSFDDANKKKYNEKRIGMPNINPKNEKNDEEKEEENDGETEQTGVLGSFRNINNQDGIKNKSCTYFKNKENDNLSHNNRSTSEHENKIEEVEPKANRPKKIKNINDFLTEKKNTQKITVFVGEKIQKVKADFKYGEDAPQNFNQKTVYESVNIIKNCNDDSKGNEKRVIEKKQEKTVFVAQRCEKSNADARAGEALIKKVPEKTVFESQRCEKSNADARAGEVLIKKVPEKTVFESQRCEKSNADARAGEVLIKKVPEKTVFESQRCEKSNADARAGEVLIKKVPEKTVFESQRCEKSNADARAGEVLIKKVPEKTVFESQRCETSNADARTVDKLKEISSENVIYESQKCNEIITDFRASDKIKEVMKRNMLDECHNI